MMMSLPIVHAAGKRYRARLRYVGGLRILHVSDVYPEGTVHRFWLGILLLIVMVDIA